MFYNKLNKYILLTFLMSIIVSNLSFADTTKKTEYTWKKTENTWICYTEENEFAKGFIEYENETYYIGKKGVMKTGWLKISTSWYYFNEESGALEKDTWIDNYYVDDDGKMTVIK